MELKAEAIELGGETFQDWIRRWQQCVETDVWPSKWDGQKFISLPDFAFRQADASAVASGSM